jgi:hypothetical protein
LLDAALGRLRQKEHDAVIPRYFQGKSLGEVGLALGITEDAAKKRVSRALEKLRNYFSKRGLALSTRAAQIEFNVKPECQTREAAARLSELLDDPDANVRSSAISSLRMMARRVDRRGGQRTQYGSVFAPKVEGLVPYLIKAASDRAEQNRVAESLRLSPGLRLWGSSRRDRILACVPEAASSSFSSFQKAHRR